jgi:hypothetical protein
VCQAINYGTASFSLAYSCYLSTVSLDSSRILSSGQKRALYSLQLCICPWENANLYATIIRSNLCLLPCDDDFVSDAQCIHSLGPARAVEKKESRKMNINLGVSGKPQRYSSIVVRPEGGLSKSNLCKTVPNPISPVEKNLIQQRFKNALRSIFRVLMHVIPCWQALKGRSGNTSALERTARELAPVFKRPSRKEWQTFSRKPPRKMHRRMALIRYYEVNTVPICRRPVLG